MVATINIFGNSDWAVKITSLLQQGEYAQYDENTFSEARNLPWIIAEESGDDREGVAINYLNTETFTTLFKGLDDLTGVTVGDGLVVGPGTLIRPTTVIGNQVYIGAGTIIDINCTIEDNVTIGDNVTITSGSLIEKGSTIKSGSII
jgi:NDP-sugar pyrophosphorylase family protein|tara:strand:+ start:2108 stop:2548 length:441 start_codon:yes stop_codon:yes gene_type:complete